MNNIHLLSQILTSVLMAVIIAIQMQFAQTTMDLSLVHAKLVSAETEPHVMVSTVFAFVTPRQKPEGYCNDHRVCLCKHFTLFTLQVAIQVGSLPNLAWWLVMGRGWCLLLDVPVRWSQPFRSTGFYLKMCFQTFRTAGRNSSWISTKLGITIGYGSGVMPIVGRSGPMITTVPVHWFLPKNGVFIYFSHWREKFRLDLNQT